jgi:hypothetical protein
VLLEEVFHLRSRCGRIGCPETYDYPACTSIASRPKRGQAQSHRPCAGQRLCRAPCPFSRPSPHTTTEPDAGCSKPWRLKPEGLIVSSTQNTATCCEGFKDKPMIAAASRLESATRWRCIAPKR